MINLTILGIPQALKRHRPSARGGYYDPSSKEKKRIWRQILKYRPEVPYAGEIYLKIIFYMPRPKYHYRTGKYSNLIKDKCKDMVYHSKTPDLDNLVKLVADVIQGTNRIICDDSVNTLSPPLWL